MSPLFLTLTLTTTLLLTLLPTLTHSTTTSYPGPTPVIAHFSFDSLPYNSQYNSYTSAPPRTPTAPPPPTLVTAQSAVPCPFNDCASFNDQSYLEVAPFLPLVGSVDGGVLGSWSVGVWVKSEQSGWQGILGLWAGGDFVWSLRLLDNTPKLFWVYRDTYMNQQRVELLSSHTVSTSGWTHLVVTYNATSHSVQFWLDGRLTDTFMDTAQATYSYLGAEPAVAWQIGMIEDVMYGYQGAMDELWAFSDVLTPDEILLLHAINSIGSCAPGTAGVAQYRVGTCTTCQPGSFSPDIGGLVCEVCPAGTASATAGAIACQACAAGSYAPYGNSTQCLTCPAGYYSPTPGATSCLPCAAGTYSTTNGSSTCTYCPANTLSLPASTNPLNCSTCPVGTTGGGTIPVCCTNGVSTAGTLLASVGVGLGGFGVVNQCVLQMDVAQVQGQFVDQLSDYCGVGYDSVLTQSLQSVYSQFNAFQSQADQAALQRIYCNP